MIEPRSSIESLSAGPSRTSIRSRRDSSPESTVSREERAPQAEDGTGPRRHGSALLFKRLRRDLPPPTARQLQFIFYALMLCMLLLGWNDGSLGPLLPFLQSHYKINYLIMSLNWITNFAGGIISGFTYIYITDRIGFGLAACSGAASQAIGYAFMSTGSHYALFLVGTAFLGFGFGLQEAQVNNMSSRLPGASTKVFIVQACFGLGATLAPFISTPFAQHVSKAYLYFLVAMGLALFTVVFMGLAIQGRTEKQTVGHLPPDINEKKKKNRPVEVELQRQMSASARIPAAAYGIDSDPQPGPDAPGEKNAAPAEPDRPEPMVAELSSGAKMKKMFSTRATYAFAMYNFVYVGSEVSLSGYITSFLVHERGGSAAAGYATTGFWGGMTVGRVILIPLTGKIGYQVSIYLYTVLAVILEVIIWKTNSLIGNAVCYALVGMCLGPIYPAALMVIADILPDDIRGAVMGFTGTAGGAGGAALPFITGAMADRFGIWTIQPLVVALFLFDLILWAIVPRKKIVLKS